MLARLDAELSPAWAEVNHSGTFLRVMQARGAADRRLVQRARELMRDLGYSLEPLGPDEALPEVWYRAEQADELSAEEADILAGRLAAEFAHGQSLSSEVQGALEALLRTALFRAMVSAGDASASLESLLADLDRRAAAVLGPALLEAFRPCVREKLAAFSSFDLQSFHLGRLGAKDSSKGV